MKTSRKKMLLSSIAMLLVALVALGSATYAWFSISKTVTADKINVKAVAKAGLEISNDQEDSYATSVSFENATYNLQPVSYAPGQSDNFVPNVNVKAPGGAVTAAAGAYKSSGVSPASAASVEAGTKAEAHNAYFAAYRVFVRSAATNTGEGDTYEGHPVSATVKATGDDAKGFIRAQLIDETTAANSKIFANDTDAAATAISSTAGATAAAATTAFGTSATATATGSTSAGKPYTLLVWYEGTDAQCVDGNKNKVAALTIEFTASDM